jgi:hypothetical protein
MNKRIREVVRKLEEQAYVEHRQEYFCDNDDPTITSVSVTRHFDREKFAGLIVQECLDQVEQAKNSPFVSLDDANRMKHFVDVTKKKLKKHFGVEE